MILLIDNYDSFVYNLARYLTELGCETRVCRHDAISVSEIRELRPRAIVLSPGPGAPAQAGICLELVRQLAGEIPLLGVCLGHQVIAEALGGEVTRASEPVHGRTSLVRHEGTPLFSDLANPFRATRYHSLVVSESTLPNELRVTARTEEGIVMAIEHTRYPLYGVQFHPESILTESGHTLMRNFLRLSGITVSATAPTELEADAAGSSPLENVDLDGRVIHW